MASIFTEAIDNLKNLSQKTNSVIVSFSGGKDSLVCLDLASKVFQNITCFYMYVVPGLRHIEERLDAARKRYNVEFVQVPHWVLWDYLSMGILCDRHYSFDFKKPSLMEIYLAVMEQTKINYVINGFKKADSLWRKRFMTNTKQYRYMVSPIANWNKYEVLAYLKANRIPVPEDSLQETGAGMGLGDKPLFYVYKNYPDDFKKICKVFKYAEAVIKRAEYYGTNTLK